MSDDIKNPKQEPELPPDPASLPNLDDDIIVNDTKKNNKTKWILGGAFGLVAVIAAYSFIAAPSKKNASVDAPTPVNTSKIDSLGTGVNAPTQNPLLAEIEASAAVGELKKADASAAAGEAVVATQPVKGFKTDLEKESPKPVYQNEEFTTNNFSDTNKENTRNVKQEDDEEFTKIKEQIQRIKDGGANTNTIGDDEGQSNLSVAVPVDYLNREAAKEQSAKNDSATATKTPTAQTVEADVAAGEIMYGELTTSLDTRVTQTPVRVVIRGGKYSNAIAMGRMTNVNDEFMVLEFNMLTIGKRTYPINAIAINPNDWDAKISDKVFSNGWKRAALLAGKGYVQSYGESYLNDNMKTTVVDGAVVQNREGTLSAKARNAQALSGAMKSLDPFVQEYITKETRSYTQTFPGKEMALLFMAPVVFR